MFVETFLDLAKKRLNVDPRTSYLLQKCFKKTRSEPGTSLEELMFGMFIIWQKDGRRKMMKIRLKNLESHGCGINISLKT